MPKNKDQYAARFQLRLSNRDLRRLRALSRKGDVPIARLVRRALKHHLPQWEEALEHDRLALL